MLLKKLQLRPSQICENIKIESKCQKAKVVGWSAFMTVVAGSYLSYYSDLIFRADQMQNQALGGKLPWNEYKPTYADVEMVYKI